MRRRISLLSAAVLAGTALGLYAPTQPASGVVVCAGTLGNVFVNPGLLYPALLGVGTTTGGKGHFIDVLLFNQTNVVHGFTFGFVSSGTCAHVRLTNTLAALTGNGILKGYCGHSSGVGTISGEPFAYVSAGTLLVLTGHVGVATALPVPLLTGSCLHAEGPPEVTNMNPFRLPSGATQFVLDVAGGGLTCPNSLPPASTLVLLPEPTLFLPTQAVGLHVGPYVTHTWAVGAVLNTHLNA